MKYVYTYTKWVYDVISVSVYAYTCMLWHIETTREFANTWEADAV